jgi:hypothetical protein
MIKIEISIEKNTLPSAEQYIKMCIENNVTDMTQITTRYNTASDYYVLYLTEEQFYLKPGSDRLIIMNKFNGINYTIKAELFSQQEGMYFPLLGLYRISFTHVSLQVINSTTTIINIKKHGNNK